MTVVQCGGDFCTECASGRCDHYRTGYAQAMLFVPRTRADHLSDLYNGYETDGPK